MLYNDIIEHLCKMSILWSPTLMDSQCVSHRIYELVSVSNALQMSKKPPRPHCQVPSHCRFYEQCQLVGLKWSLWKRSRNYAWSRGYFALDIYKVYCTPASQKLLTHYTVKIFGGISILIANHISCEQDKYLIYSIF